MRKHEVDSLYENNIGQACWPQNDCNIPKIPLYRVTGL